MNDTIAPQARKRVGLHWITRTVVVLLLLYVGSYIAVSRWSAHLVRRDWNGFGFYYIPVRPDKIIESRTWQRVHQVGSIIYWPLWYIDFHLLGGPTIASVPMTGVTIWKDEPRPD